MALPGPVFVNVILEQGTCVNPKLVVNKPIEDMSPELDREELAREMIIALVDDEDDSK
jgi:acetolactate synthase-1/2/3 large subunit